MAYHAKKNMTAFRSSMQNASMLGEQEFQDAMNRTIVSVETDDNYTINQKLKIYAELQQLANCTEKDRKKFVNKVAKML